MNQIRSFNKHFLNHLTGRFANASRGPFALVQHVGRRSGRVYETTIMVAPTTGGFVIALTYGPDVDWYRNVVAAGKCEIKWHGKAYPITKLEPLDKSIGRRAFPQPLRTILTILGTSQFLTMKS